jgi:hypothetical protein
MTMRTAYFDCFSGISGDMTIGALLDAGLGFEDLRAQLALLNLHGYELSVEKVKKRGFGGTKFLVRVGDGEPPRRGLHEIEAIIKASALDARVQERILAVFTRLAEAEAAVHQSTVERVHFHEVGAIDAIVDITGAVISLQLLGIQRILSSPINVGSGFVRAAHGVLPVPAPGTAELLKNTPIYARGTDGELTTPTGAALITTLAESFGTLPCCASTVSAMGQEPRNCLTLRTCCECSLGRTRHQTRSLTARQIIMSLREPIIDIVRMAYQNNGSRSYPISPHDRWLQFDRVEIACMADERKTYP